MHNKKSTLQKIFCEFFKVEFIHTIFLRVCEILHAMPSLSQSVREKGNHNQNTFFKIIPEGPNKDRHLK